MKGLVLAAAVAVFTAPAVHAGIHVGDVDCSVHSDYSLAVEPDRLEFTRHAGSPSKIVIADGTLSVDGRTLDVDGADRRRLRDIEHGVRDTIPEVKEIVHEAIAIAISAVSEVSAAFAKDSESARASSERVARLAHELDRRIDDTNSFEDWKDGDVERLIGSITGTLVSEIVGNVAGQAIAVALSGDEKAAAELEARADGIDKKIDKVVEKRSKALEARAEALCPRLLTLAHLEDGLDVRLPDGRRLDLVRVDD